MESIEDTPELEALFDSVAASYSEKVPEGLHKPKLSMSHSIRPFPAFSNGDSQELEALFDQIASNFRSKEQEDASVAPSEECLISSRLGGLIRALDSLLYRVAPDASAEAPAGAQVDRELLLRTVEKIQQETTTLAEKWDLVFSNKSDPQNFRLLAEETRAFLKSTLPVATGTVSARVRESSSASDRTHLMFQPTGRFLEELEFLEVELMQVLIQTLSQSQRESEAVSSLLTDPVQASQGRGLMNLQWVRDLLKALGF